MGSLVQILPRRIVQNQTEALKKKNEIGSILDYVYLFVRCGREKHEIVMM